MNTRGGRRKTSWSESWNHGKTKVIRVPESLCDQIMEYARSLDCGAAAPHVSQEQLQKTFLLAIDTFVEQRLEKSHPNQYSCIPSTNTRRWDELRKLRNLIAQEPNKILAISINPPSPNINPPSPSINPLAHPDFDEII